MRTLVEDGPHGPNGGGKLLWLEPSCHVDDDRGVCGEQARRTDVAGNGETARFEALVVERDRVTIANRAARDHAEDQVVAIEVGQDQRWAGSAWPIVSCSSFVVRSSSFVLRGKGRVAR